MPTRNLVDALLNFQKVVSKMYLTRTPEKPTPSRTTLGGSESTSVDEEIDLVGTTQEGFEEHIRREIEKEIRQSLESQIFDKDSDISYNNIFDADEYKDIVKKVDSDLVSSYEDRTIEDNKDNEPVETLQNFLEKDRENETNVEYRMFPDVDAGNKLSNITGASDKDLAELATENSSDQKTDRSKRRPACNMIKLRQLNFNSPRTLPEV